MPLSPSIKLNNGLLVPQLGLGTWKSAPREVGQAVEYAIKEAGYRHIDCAAIYENEPEIGAAFAKIFNEGKIRREEVFVTSKLWNNAHARDRVRPACEKTLADLRLDYLDLYLIHWGYALSEGAVYDKTSGIAPPMDPIPIRETWEAMEGLVKAGLVKSIGVANFTVMMLFDLLTYAKIKPAVNQVEIHPYNAQPRLVEFCQKHNIAVTAYSPLGRLGYSPGEHDKPLQCPEKISENKVIKKIADARQKTPAQVALRWLVQRNIIAIPKSTHPERIKENIGVFDFSLSPSEMTEINSLDRGFRFVDPYDWWGFGYFD